MIFLEAAKSTLTEGDLLSTINDLINHLYENIDNLQNLYLWIFGTIITAVSALLSTIFALLYRKQSKFSKNEIEKIRKDFKINEFDNKIQNLDDKTEEFYKNIKELKKSIQKSKEEREASRKEFNYLKKQIISSSLESSCTLFESSDSSTIPITISNFTSSILRILNMSEKGMITAKAANNSLIAFSNGINNIQKNENFHKSNFYVNAIKKIKIIKKRINTFVDDTNLSNQQKNELSKYNDIVKKTIEEIEEKHKEYIK